jgi:hypothetical protein
MFKIEISQVEKLGLSEPVYKRQLLKAVKGDSFKAIYLMQK